ASKLSLRCATWNIHRAKGRDGVVDPERVVKTIESRMASLGLDVLALQEADEERRPHAKIVDVEQIARIVGLDYAHDHPNLRWGPESHGFLGTILFLHPRLRRLQTDLIDLPGHCHRGVVAIEVQTAGRNFRIASTHLSLSQPLRILQMRIFGQYLRRRPRMQTIFLGDFNEWRPWGGLMFNNRLVGTTLRGPAHRTFPSKRPMLPLDRILTDPPGRLSDVGVLKDPEFSASSDHLPLMAVVEIP
ncbi:MAG: endonuclease/exonuclease/phosphatase family protein, partial [Pseudomonadota bacterium]